MSALLTDAPTCLMLAILSLAGYVVARQFARRIRGSRREGGYYDQIPGRNT